MECVQPIACCEKRISSNNFKNISRVDTLSYKTISANKTTVTKE